MIEGRRVVALVPMRHHSERVPGKNYRSLAGKPLYAYILETLGACPALDAIVVDTDSETIAAGVRRQFPQVQLIRRPEHLRDDHIPMNDVLAHDLSQVEADFYLQTHSTNPLLRSETVERALRAFIEHYPEHDSLFSVTRLQTRLWTAQGEPLNHDPQVLIRTQDLPPIYEENSCLYIFGRREFLARGNRLGARPLLFEIPAAEAWDIDEELDFRLVECLMRARFGQDGAPQADEAAKGP